MKDVCLLMLNPVLVVSLGKHWSAHTLKFCCRWVTGEGMCAGSSAYGVDSSCPGDSISLLHAQSDHPGFSTQAWRKRPHGAPVSSSDAPGHCRLSDVLCFRFQCPFVKLLKTKSGLGGWHLLIQVSESLSA